MKRFRKPSALATLLAALIACGAAAASTLPEEKERLRADAVQAMIERLGLRASEQPVREMPGWKPPRKVVVRVDRPDRLAGFQAVAPGVEIVAVSTVDEAAGAAEDAQALIGFCNEEILAAGRELHWIQVYSSGVDRCVGNPGLHRGDKILTNGQRIASPALAEHAIALMMALVRGLDVYHRNQLAGEWKRDAGLAREDFMELEGRTVLVVGLGGIGTQVARRAHGLGMRVVATRGSRREGPEYVDYVGLADEVNGLARQADVVINTAPLTDRTRGMFDAAFFEAMKDSAYFVSVGRGASTVTGDLVAALEEGRIAGAGLDVTDPEPLPEGHALWQMPRVIISPHTAGRSDKGRERLFLLVQENLRRYVAGEPLLSVVDIERGY
ncbi:MAG: D-2-hydroxyacid dehydrogenase [Xanthomonadales bacterium]|nr:D-2-hydroxyacid dehydrogenase [Xanthomonadales bacterium]